MTTTTTSIAEAAQLVQDNAAMMGHDNDLLDRGLIAFATTAMAGYLTGLTQRCGVPEDARLMVVCTLVGREIGSTKSLSIYEARAMIEYLLYGTWGQSSKEEGQPCDEAKATLSGWVLELMAAAYQYQQARLW